MPAFPSNPNHATLFDQTSTLNDVSDANAIRGRYQHTCTGQGKDNPNANPISYISNMAIRPAQHKKYLSTPTPPYRTPLHTTRPSRGHTPRQLITEKSCKSDVKSARRVLTRQNSALWEQRSRSRAFRVPHTLQFFFLGILATRIRLRHHRAFCHETNVRMLCLETRKISNRCAPIPRHFVGKQERHLVSRVSRSWLQRRTPRTGYHTCRVADPYRTLIYPTTVCIPVCCPTSSIAHDPCGFNAGLTNGRYQVVHLLDGKKNVASINT